MWTRTLLFRRFTDINVYGTGSVKYGKLAAKYPWIYGYFLQCTGTNDDDDDDDDTDVDLMIC